MPYPVCVTLDMHYSHEQLYLRSLPEAGRISLNGHSIPLIFETLHLFKNVYRLLIDSKADIRVPDEDGNIFIMKSQNKEEKTFLSILQKAMKANGEQNPRWIDLKVSDLEMVPISSMIDLTKPNRLFTGDTIMGLDHLLHSLDVETEATVRLLKILQSLLRLLKLEN